MKKLLLLVVAVFCIATFSRCRNSNNAQQEQIDSISIAEQEEEAEDTVSPENYYVNRLDDSLSNIPVLTRENIDSVERLIKHAAKVFSTPSTCSAVKEINERICHARDSFAMRDCIARSKCERQTAQFEKEFTAWYAFCDALSSFRLEWNRIHNDDDPWICLLDDPCELYLCHTKAYTLTDKQLPKNSEVDKYRQEFKQILLKQSNGIGGKKRVKSIMRTLDMWIASRQRIHSSGGTGQSHYISYILKYVVQRQEDLK